MESRLAAVESSITTLTTQASNIGSSLFFICKSIDTQHNICCINHSINKLVCGTTTAEATLLGITSQTTGGTCGGSTDTICAGGNWKELDKGFTTNRIPADVLVQELQSSPPVFATSNDFL